MRLHVPASGHYVEAKSIPRAAKTFLFDINLLLRHILHESCLVTERDRGAAIPYVF